MICTIRRGISRSGLNSVISSSAKTIHWRKESKPSEKNELKRASQRSGSNYEKEEKSIYILKSV